MFLLTENFITPEAESILLGEIQRTMALVRPRQKDGERSRILRYGWDYFSPVIWNGALPLWVPPAMEGCDNLSINEYPPGHSILPHIDSRNFQDTIKILSLGVSATMVFISPMGKEQAHVLPPRSLAEFSGELRTKWKHTTLPTDEGWRYSVVYRRKV